MMKNKQINFNQNDYESLKNHIDHNFLTKAELAIANEYLKAFQLVDYEKLAWFEQFGDKIRNRVMNVNEYRYGLNYGFMDIILDKYGWLSKAEFKEVEVISFKTDLNNCSYNFITIGKGINGRWTFGCHLVFGAAGSSYGLSVFSPYFETKNEVIESGLNYMKQAHQKALLNTHDSTNYKLPMIKKVLDRIEAYEYSKLQLTLF